MYKHITPLNDKHIMLYYYKHYALPHLVAHFPDRAPVALAGIAAMDAAALPPSGNRRRSHTART